MISKHFKSSVFISVLAGSCETFIRLKKKERKKEEETAIRRISPRWKNTKLNRFMFLNLTLVSGLSDLTRHCYYNVLIPLAKDYVLLLLHNTA